MSNDIRISKRKPFFTINRNLSDYLGRFGRSMSLPLTYSDLLKTNQRMTLYDDNGEDTLWQVMLYSPGTTNYLQKALTQIYALLKTDGDMSTLSHLYIERIDFCTFGNSKPFRIKIVNQYNDNYDYFYIKTADSSRVCGLELEDLLSPNRLNYLVDEVSGTLIEEHIIGIPGDMFIENYLQRPTINKVRLAKEFIKFNERCFIRLLGDMRSYNYVVDITPDFDNEQYRVRAIDFDQQSYEGKKNIYLPQFFKENYPIVKFVIENIQRETMTQYQKEERTLMAKRLAFSFDQIHQLIQCIDNHGEQSLNKVRRLKKELNQHHQTTKFSSCARMADVLEEQLNIMLHSGI